MYLKYGMLDGKCDLQVDEFRKMLRFELNNGFLFGYREFYDMEYDLASLFRSGYEDDRRFNGDDKPVVGVTWYAARTYCLWLSLMESNGHAKDLYRLPTEVEWE